MATPQEDLEQINNLIKDLKIQLNDTSEFVPLKNLQDAKMLFVSMKREVDAIGDGLSFVARSFRDSVAELSKQNTELNTSKNSLKGISSIAQKILTTRSIDGSISEKELNTLEKKAQLQFDSLKIAVTSGRLQGKALSEAKNALKAQKEFFKATESIKLEQLLISQNAGVKLFTGLEDITNAIPGLRKFTGAFKEASTASQEQAIFNKTAFGDAQGMTNAQIESNKAINAALQDGRNLTKSKIKDLGLENVLIDKNGKALVGTAAKAKAESLGLGKMATKSITPLAAGLKSLGPILTKALGPLVLLSALIKQLKFFDEQTGKAAKNLGISYDEASGLTQELSQSADFSDSLFINSTNLLGAQVQISQVLGTNVKLNQDLLKSQVELTKQAGFSVETATTLSTLSVATGISTDNITESFLGQTVALNAQNKVQVNSKQLLDGINKVSKGTLATFSSQPKELAKAVFQAKKLGLEISTLESIADGLLDIESSLTAEFEAETITGKALNLERARFFALTNDIAGVGREIEAQGITQKSFSKSNRIEQEAIAKAVGLSRDQLGQSLILRAGLVAAGADDAEAAREKFEILKAQGGEAFAISKLGETEYARQLASVSAQEKFVEVTNKLRDAFVSIAVPVLQIVGPIVDTLAPVLTGIANTVSFIVKSFQKLVGVFTGSNEQLGKMEAFVGSIAATYALIKGYALATQVIEGVKLGYQSLQNGLLAKRNLLDSRGLTKSIGTAIFKAIAALSSLGPLGVGLGLAAAATIGTIAFKYSQGDDVMSPGGGGYGSRTLMGPEGSIALNNKDTVIAGTNLFPKDRESRNTSSAVQIDYDRLADAIAMGAEKGTSRANVTTNLDGAKVSNRIQAPLAINSRKYSV